MTHQMKFCHEMKEPLFTAMRRSTNFNFENGKHNRFIPMSPNPKQKVSKLDLFLTRRSTKIVGVFICD